MPLSRRHLLKAGLASGALLAAHPFGALARTLGTFDQPGAVRASRLHPGLLVAHGDLHNHSHLSDGDGDPTFMFDSIRSGGLDFAALTDHSTLSWGPAGLATDLLCGAFDGAPEHGESGDCRSLAGLDDAGWEHTHALAAAADDPGHFAAIPAFEWSSPFLGHVNVWFSQDWIDPLHTAGGGPQGLGEHARAIPGAGDHLGPLLDELLRQHAPNNGTGMAAFYEWLGLEPGTPGIGGGLDGIAGFNHPGREEGRFGYFEYFPQVADRFVTMEILNRREDYLFKSFHDGQPSPLVECLNAGWRVGLIGVTDEHSDDWGAQGHLGKGRAGLWLTELSRAGVRAALEDRRVFATFEVGLRLDATLNGVQMGRGVGHGSGPATFVVDLDHGDEWVGRNLEVQVLRPGDHLPEVADVVPFQVPAPDDPFGFTLDLDRADGDWVVLRIADPSQPNNHPGPDGHPCNNLAVGYSSPWWLEG